MAKLNTRIFDTPDIEYSNLIKCYFQTPCWSLEIVVPKKKLRERCSDIKVTDTNRLAIKLCDHSHFLGLFRSWNLIFLSFVFVFCVHITFIFDTETHIDGPIRFSFLSRLCACMYVCVYQARCFQSLALCSIVVVAVDGLVGVVCMASSMRWRPLVADCTSMTVWWWKQ